MRSQCSKLVRKNEDLSLHLSVVVIGKISKGIERIRPKHNAQANAIENWLVAVDKAFGERILPVDCTVANEWGRLYARRPLPVIDGLLAATAKTHRMILVTRNTAYIDGLDVNILSPFELSHNLTNLFMPSAQAARGMRTELRQGRGMVRNLAGILVNPVGLVEVAPQKRDRVKVRVNRAEM
jgi:predicted nucleic acid-binding protein